MSAFALAAVGLVPVIPSSPIDEEIVHRGNVETPVMASTPPIVERMVKRERVDIVDKVNFSAFCDLTRRDITVLSQVLKSETLDDQDRVELEEIKNSYELRLDQARAIYEQGEAESQEKDEILAQLRDANDFIQMELAQNGLIRDNNAHLQSALLDHQRRNLQLERERQNATRRVRPRIDGEDPQIIIRPQGILERIDIAIRSSLKEIVSIITDVALTVGGVSLFLCGNRALGIGFIIKATVDAYEAVRAIYNRIKSNQMQLAH